MEDSYDEFKILDESGKEIIGEQRMADIEVSLEAIAAWSARLEPIRPTLARLEKGGFYESVAYDMSDGKVVFIKHDGARTALAPEQIAHLFGIGPRPAAPAFTS